MYEWIAHHLIGTVLQRPAERLRWWMGFRRRRLHPELGEIYAEGERSRNVIRRAVRDGDNCVDVGAHLGSVLAHFLKLSPNGRHAAVEPLAYKARWLERKFPGVAVHEVALGEQAGEVEFFWNRSQSGYSGLRSAGKNAKEATSTRVRLRRLDEVIPKDVKVDFIKIDVEGAELHVFRGASRILLEQRPRVLFECTRTGLENFGVRAEEVFELLSGKYGYAVYLLKDWLAQGPSIDVERFARSMVYPFQAFNFLAAPKEKPFPAEEGQRRPS